MTKKEFKKKCKEEKTTSYQLQLFGGIITVIAFIIVMVTMFCVKEPLTQIRWFILGAIFAIIGMSLDIAGEIKLSKEFKKYNV